MWNQSTHKSPQKAARVGTGEWKEKVRIEMLLHDVTYRWTIIYVQEVGMRMGCEPHHPQSFWLIYPLPSSGHPMLHQSQCPGHPWLPSAPNWKFHLLGLGHSNEMLLPSHWADPITATLTLPMLQHGNFALLPNYHHYCLHQILALRPLYNVSNQGTMQLSAQPHCHEWDQPTTNPLVCCIEQSEWVYV